MPDDANECTYSWRDTTRRLVAGREQPEIGNEEMSLQRFRTYERHCIMPAKLS